MRGSALVVVAAMMMVASTGYAKKWPNKRPSAAELGAQIYDEKCTGCHGAKGAGDGPGAAALVGTVPDFSKGFGKLEREALIRSVLRGKKLMPSFDTMLSREDVEAAIQHMSQVGKPKPKPKEGEGKEGEGGKDGAKDGAKDAPAKDAPAKDAPAKDAPGEEDEPAREAAPPPPE